MCERAGHLGVLDGDEDRGGLELPDPDRQYQSVARNLVDGLEKQHVLPRGVEGDTGHAYLDHRPSTRLEPASAGAPRRSPGERWCHRRHAADARTGGCVPPGRAGATSGIHSPEWMLRAYGCTRHAAIRHPLVRTLRPARRRTAADRGRLDAAGDRPRRRDGRARRERHVLPCAPLRAPAVVADAAARGDRRAHRADRSRHRRDRHALREPPLPRRGSGRGRSHLGRAARARREPRVTRDGGAGL